MQPRRRTSGADGAPLAGYETPPVVGSPPGPRVTWGSPRPLLPSQEIEQAWGELQEFDLLGPPQQQPAPEQLVARAQNPSWLQQAFRARRWSDASAGSGQLSRAATPTGGAFGSGAPGDAPGGRAAGGLPPSPPPRSVRFSDASLPAASPARSPARSPALSPRVSEASGPENPELAQAELGSQYSAASAGSQQQQGPRLTTLMAAESALRRRTSSAASSPRGPRPPVGIAEAEFRRQAMALDTSGEEAAAARTEAGASGAPAAAAAGAATAAAGATAAAEALPPAAGGGAAAAAATTASKRPGFFAALFGIRRVPGDVEAPPQSDPAGAPDGGATADAVADASAMATPVIAAPAAAPAALGTKQRWSTGRVLCMLLLGLLVLAGAGVGIAVGVTQARLRRGSVAPVPQPGSVPLNFNLALQAANKNASLAPVSCAAWFESGKSIEEFRQTIATAYAQALDVPVSAIAVGNISCNGTTMHG